MARTKAADAPETGEDISPEVSNAVTEIQQTGSAIVDAAMNEQQKAAATVNQRIGRKQMMQVFSKLVTVTDLVDLQNLKESKGYKNHTIVDLEGKLVTLRTWEEYCQIVEGRSRESVDLDLKNLNALGPELFESMRNVGIGPATMRAIRQLPDDDQQLIQQAVDTTDKSELAEFVEQLITKNAKEKADLNKKLDDATANLQAKDAVAETNAKRINELQEKVALVKRLPPEEQVVKIRSEITGLITAIDHDMRVNFYNAIEKLKEVDGDSGEFVRNELRTLAETVEFLQVELGGEVPDWMKDQ